MQQIKLTRGLDVKLDGKAALTDGSVMKPAVYHIVPDHFAGIKPRLLVHEGDKVKAGSPLFQDKTFAEMLFTSPVSGTVSAIVRGERRKVLSIDIEADATMQYEAFDSKQDLKALLLQSGLWALIKQRPYDCIALPNKTPKAVFISSFDSAPLAP
ncbi:MAG: NADH:ubiquinone reductase (Na(+)-transporting) subunit A, partial [Paludibacteraceae bacterium]|nr:NADH:ubiquinone reductase (Na(+)-transporting) subunit A [Paludibacteraceae bacterium]